MVRLRATASLASAVILAFSVGCRSTQQTQQHVAMGPDPSATVVQAGGQQPALAETQPSVSHLMQVAELLTIQHQYAQAAEVYQKVLERDPQNAVAKQQLQKLPISNLPQQYGNPAPSQPSTSPVASPPTAPPANDEIPIIRDINPAHPPSPNPTEQTPAFPTDVGQIPQVSPPEMPKRQYQISSQPGGTQVTEPSAEQPFQNASDSKKSGEHTIKIIPASKHHGPQPKELKFPGNPSTKSEAPQQMPVQTTSMQTGNAKPTATPAKAEPQKTEAPAKIAPAVVSEAKPAEAKPPVKQAAPQPIVPKELIELNGYVKTPAKHVDAIAKQLTHYSPRVRALAAYLLGRSGTAAVNKIAPLETALNDEKHGPARIRIAEALLRLKAGHVVALQTLESGLQSEQRDTRWEAVCVADVVAKHEKRSTVLALLLERLHDVHADVRTMSALKLGEFRDDDGLTIGPLEETLRQAGSDDGLRKAAAASLAVLRPATIEQLD